MSQRTTICQSVGAKHKTSKSSDVDPEDLCDRIRYACTEPTDIQQRDDLLKYSVIHFITYRLGQNPDFIALLHDIPGLGDCLCRISSDHAFIDKGAGEIISIVREHCAVPADYKVVATFDNAAPDLCGTDDMDSSTGGNGDSE
ncbi:MAG: hypothetical protein M1812_004823 [Candelaria pacifica]|nr:MAG: hypothetical protein M1812_004823 [Candelaria pacifica]